MADVLAMTKGSILSFERERGVYAVDVMHEVAHAVVTVGSGAECSARTLQLVKALAAAKVPIFLVKLHGKTVTLALPSNQLEIAESVIEKQGFAVSTQDGLAVIAVRAASMRELSGIMAGIADSLFIAGATLYETGDSHDSVQCLIDGSKVEAAVHELAVKFGLSASQVKYTSIFGATE